MNGSGGGGHSTGPHGAMVRRVEFDPYRGSTGPGGEIGRDRGHRLGESCCRAAVQEAVGLGVPDHRHSRHDPLRGCGEDSDAESFGEAAETGQ